MPEIDREVKHHFEEISSHYYSVVDATPFLYGYYHTKEVSFIQNALDAFFSESSNSSRPSSTILDIGCATGRVIKYIQDFRPESHFVGLDISARMIRLAKEDTGPNVEYVVGDIRSLPFRSETFDFVYSLEVIEHLDRKSIAIPLAVNEAMRVTREGGSTTLESTSLWHFRLQEVIKWGLPGAHTSLMQKQSLSRFSDTYRKVPLKVAEPSAFEFVRGLISSNGGEVKSTSWIRIIPEQTFVVIDNDLFRTVLVRIDELLTRIPGLRRLGREFIISCVKRNNVDA